MSTIINDDGTDTDEEREQISFTTSSRTMSYHSEFVDKKNRSTGSDRRSTNIYAPKGNNHLLNTVDSLPWSNILTSSALIVAKSPSSK